MFVGRQKELELLEDAYTSPKSELVVIYGRRRILDIEPKGLHDRVAVILGSKNVVERVTRYHQEAQTAETHRLRAGSHGAGR